MWNYRLVSAAVGLKKTQQFNMNPGTFVLPAHFYMFTHSIKADKIKRVMMIRINQQNIVIITL